MNRPNYSLRQKFWYPLYAAGALVIVIFWWRATGHVTTARIASLEQAAGNLTGLLGTYAILWQMVLLGRLTFLENTFGLETLTWLHKWNGYLALTFILLHTVFLIWGFGGFAHISFWKQMIDFIFNWQDVLKATLATAILIVAVCMSIGIVRRGFKYETWYFVHLFIYLAILLGFFHQLTVGSDLAGNAAFQIYWYGLYITAIGVLIAYRFVRPFWLMYKYVFRVERVVNESPDIISVYITGQGLDRLNFAPGQFMIWRFCSRQLWWQAHPFSISVAPNGQYLRITVKQLGDFTRSLTGLQPGTLVMIDGPHGHFTGDRLQKPDLLLIAGGVGITPIRSLLERLPLSIRTVSVVYAARTRTELALGNEINELSARIGGHVRYLLSAEQAPGFAHGLLDQPNLLALVPDVANREVMLCGPPGMMNAVTKTLMQSGVAHTHIHTERFAY